MSCPSICLEQKHPNVVKNLQMASCISTQAWAYALHLLHPSAVALCLLDPSPSYPTALALRRYRHASCIGIPRLSARSSAAACVRCFPTSLPSTLLLGVCCVLVDTFGYVYILFFDAHNSQFYGTWEVPPSPKRPWAFQIPLEISNRRVSKSPVYLHSTLLGCDAYDM